MAVLRGSLLLCARANRATQITAIWRAAVSGGSVAVAIFGALSAGALIGVSGPVGGTAYLDATVTGPLLHHAIRRHVAAVGIWS